MIKELDDYVLEGLMDPSNTGSHGVIPLGLERLGIDVGDSFSVNNGSISITRLADKDRTARKSQKYPPEQLQGWPYPTDSEMKSCPFRREGSVAVVAPNRNKKTLQMLIQCYERGADAVGFCHTPHVGVERLIGNLVGNPNYRYLFVVGLEGVFGSGRSLACAHYHGIDWESGLVLGADASISAPMLLRIQRQGKELGERILSRFRDQVALVDMIGEDLSTTCLSFLTRLCKEQKAQFEVVVKGEKHLLTAKSAFEDEAGLAEPISFRPKELAFINVESAGSSQTSSLLVESIGKAYELVIGTALEHGRLATLSNGTEGLQIRNLSVLCEDPLNNRIPEKVIPEGIITEAEDKKEFLEKYAFWTYLIPCSRILWKPRERTAVPIITQEITYGTKLCVGRIDQLQPARKSAIVEYVRSFQEQAGDSLPKVDDVLEFYRGLSDLGKSNGLEQQNDGDENGGGINQLREVVDEMKADIKQGATKECYTLVIDADQRYEIYLVPIEGALKLETAFSSTRDNALNWFPRAYGGTKLGLFLSVVLGLSFAAYVHQSKFFEMSRANVSEELYKRKRTEAFGVENSHQVVERQ